MHRVHRRVCLTHYCGSHVTPATKTLGPIHRHVPVHNLSLKMINDLGRSSRLTVPSGGAPAPAPAPAPADSFGVNLITSADPRFMMATNG